MNKTRGLLIGIFCAIHSLTLAGVFSLDSIGSENNDGISYTLHKVDDNETLYSLSRKYNVPIYEIIKNNPPTEFGLEKGQVLRIPRNSEKNEAVATVPEQYTGNSTLNSEIDQEAEVVDEITTPLPPVIKEKEILSNKKEQVKHIVEEKQTLFSISRMYDVSVSDIKSWNQLSSNALDIGQVLVINKGTDNTTTKTENLTGKWHEVKPSETLFSISRKYELTVDDLKKWNKLQTNEISIGQKLFIEKPDVSVSEPNVIKNTDQKEEKEIVKVTLKDQKVENEPIDTVKYNITPLERPNFEEIIESGLAEQIEGSSGNRKYLALHKSARIGTIIKVKNEMNDQEVFVRVIGSLPKTSVNDNMVIKISKSAYDRIGAIDPKFRVTISYIP